MWFFRKKKSKERAILQKRAVDLDTLRGIYDQFCDGLKIYENKIDRAKAIMAEMDLKIEAESDDIIAERYQSEFETSEAILIAAQAEQVLVRENIYVLNEIIETIDNWLIKSNFGENLKYLGQIDAYLNIKKLKAMIGEPVYISSYLKGIAKIIYDTRQQAEQIAQILSDAREIKTKKIISTRVESETMPATAISKALSAKREAIRQKRELESLQFGANIVEKDDISLEIKEKQ